MDDLVEENIAETKSLQEEFAPTQALMDEAASKLQEQLEDLRQRFEARESREEDLAEIRALRDTVAERDAQLQQAQEELRYYKLELLNREENFNQRFGVSGPSV